MRKVILFILFIVIYSQSLFAIDFFKGNYQEATLKAKKENKLIFLYFTATWCGPCKYMDQYIFPNASLTEYINQNYIALKIDVDDKAGKLLYVKAHQPAGPMGVPAFIILNEKEEVLKKGLGGMKLNQLQDFLLIDKSRSVIYKLLADSIAGKQIITSTKNPTTLSKFMFNSMASKWKPAIKIGTNLMTYHSSLPASGSVIGYEIGVFFDRSFKNSSGKRPGFWHSSRYHFQPGLSLTSKGGNISQNGLNTRINIHYLELSLLNSYQFKGMRYYGLFASPYVSTGLWATNSLGSEKRGLDLGDDYSRIDYGFRLGISRHMGNFEPFLGYNLGLKDIKNGPESMKNQGFYLSFAIIFGK